MNAGPRVAPGARFAPEARVLFAALDPVDLPASRERIRAAAAAVTDWLALIRLAVGHEVAFQLHQVLARAAADQTPVGILALLEDQRRRQQERGRRAWDELREILALLAAAGVPAMPFKGPVLARQIYGDVGARVSHDLDFLVRPEDVLRVLAVLEGQGYVEPAHDGLSPAQAEGTRRLYGELAYSRAGRLMIEPHWALAQSTQAIDLECAEIWSRSRIVDLDGLLLSAPEPEDLFLMLVVHGSKEVWRKLKWVADLAALVVSGTACDWGRVLDRARRAGILRMTHVVWRLLESLGGIEAPGVFRASLAADTDGHRVAQYLERRLARGDTADHRVDRISPVRWRMRERARDRFRYAWRTLTTPRPVHYRIVRIPDRWIGLYVPLKLAHDYVCLPAVRVFRAAAAERASD